MICYLEINSIFLSNSLVNKQILTKLQVVCTQCKVWRIQGTNHFVSGNYNSMSQWDLRTTSQSLVSSLCLIYVITTIFMSKAIHVCDKLIHDERLSRHFGPYPQFWDSNPISIGLHALSIPCQSVEPFSDTRQACYNDLNVLHFQLGASPVKYTKKMLLFTKIIIILVKHLKVVAIVLLNWICFS